MTFTGLNYFMTVWLCTSNLYRLSADSEEEVLHGLSLDFYEREQKVLLQHDGLLQPPPGILHLLLQHPRGLQADTGPVGSHPQVQVGQILGPILQAESLPQTVDGLDVEELPADLPLGPGQQVLLIPSASPVRHCYLVLLKTRRLIWKKLCWIIKLRFTYHGMKGTWISGIITQD